MPARLAKIVMVIGLGLFATLVAFGNLVDPGPNLEMTRHVLAMDTTFPDNGRAWRAVTAPGLQTLGFGMIVAAEALTAALFLAAGARMAAAARGPAEVFARAKGLVHLGAAAGFLLWFVGFMALGGEWFLMWQSAAWNGQQAAFRFYMTILAVLIYVAQPDGDLPAAGQRAIQPPGQPALRKT